MSGDDSGDELGAATGNAWTGADSEGTASTIDAGRECIGAPIRRTMRVLPSVGASARVAAGASTMLRSTVASEGFATAGEADAPAVPSSGNRCTAGIASGAGAAETAGNASTTSGAGRARTGIVRAGGDGSTDGVGDGVAAVETPEGASARADESTDGAVVRLMAGAAGKRCVLAQGRIGTASAASIGSGA